MGNLFELAVLSVTAGCGWALIAYAGVASQRGWPVGTLLAAPFSWLQGVAYVAVLGCVVAGGFLFHWWYSIVVLVAANIVARLALMIGPPMQLIGIVGVLVGGLFSVSLFLV